jgi:hypothetical protein
MSKKISVYWKAEAKPFSQVRENIETPVGHQHINKCGCKIVFDLTVLAEVDRIVVELSESFVDLEYDLRFFSFRLPPMALHFPPEYNRL